MSNTYRDDLEQTFGYDQDQIFGWLAHKLCDDLFPYAEDDKEPWDHPQRMWELLSDDNAEFKREIIHRTIERTHLETARFIYEKCPEIVPPDMKDQFEALIIIGILDNARFSASEN